MKLSDEARKRAVAAFKTELILAFEQIRVALGQGVLRWEGVAIKGILHKLKGGASFLGYEDLKKELAQMEQQATGFPTETKHWFEFLDNWQPKIDKFI